MLFINRPSESAVALFGQLARDGKIQNVGLLNTDIQGLSSVGGLVANNAGLILNSYVGGLAQISGKQFYRRSRRLEMLMGDVLSTAMQMLR